MEIVYPTIRQKMAQALMAWQPSDQSARSVLMPWVAVFSKGSMDAFLVKNIVPKLQDCLARWPINPSQQELDVWKWVMQWKDLIPLANMVTLLEKYFFPKWLQVGHLDANSIGTERDVRLIDDNSFGKPAGSGHVAQSLAQLRRDRCLVHGLEVSLSR